MNRNGISPIRIRQIEDAKHIFTHKEWHMKGYLIRVDELEKGLPGADTADWLMIEPQQTQTAYPIPSAFGAYSKYLDIRLGTWKSEED